MARLKLPEKAYRSKRGDNKWHLCWADMDGGPGMICGKMIFKEFRVGKQIEDIDARELCPLCLGAIEVER